MLWRRGLRRGVRAQRQQREEARGARGALHARVLLYSAGLRAPGLARLRLLAGTGLGSRRKNRASRRGSRGTRPRECALIYGGAGGSNAMSLACWIEIDHIMYCI
jgi:hypothetical protein